MPNSGENNDEINITMLENETSPTVVAMYNDEIMVSEIVATPTPDTSSNKPKILTKIHEETRTWASKSTVHGLNRVFESKRLFYKRLWLIFYLVAIFLCILSIYLTIIEYFERKVATKIEVKYVTELPFPTVLFCNLNPFITASGASYIRQFYLKKYQTNVTSYTDLLALHKKNMLTFAHDQEELFYQTFNESFDLTRKKSFGLELDHFLIDKSFDGLNGAFNPNGTYFTWYYHQTFGNCYKFNSGKRDETGQDDVVVDILNVNRKEKGFKSQLFIGKLDLNNDVLYQTASRGVIILIDDTKTFPIRKKGMVLKVQLSLN